MGNGFENVGTAEEIIGENAGTVNGSEFNLPTKVNGWTKFKNFLFKEIKVELTPAEQKVENEINEFLHQEITWKSFKNFLFQEVTFSKAKETNV